MTPPNPATPGLIQRAPLDVYKKIRIIRNPNDSLEYEDSNGRLQRITDLGESALAAVRFSCILLLLLLDEYIVILRKELSLKKAYSYCEKISKVLWQIILSETDFCCYNFFEIDTITTNKKETRYSGTQNHNCRIIQ